MQNEPLAVRMRPRIAEEIKGQSHILDTVLLNDMLNGGNPCSIILYGPPGTGKTTIAGVIANKTKAEFIKINAVSSGKKDIEAACKKAEKLLGDEGRRTILFIDEIHRFNKAQQDYLLPFVEEGIVALIGATTENPYFEINRALISRAITFELKKVSETDMEDIIKNALTDKERGLGDKNQGIEDDALAFLSGQANGDVRRALNMLESASGKAGDNATITLTDVKEAAQTPYTPYDKDGSEHYDTASAFIKSMRGSDPDAVLYYLARMIVGGEDPKFIARRIMICASEDVGNADPMAMVVASNAAMAVERIGMPEGRIILSQAALYIAMAPKSNSAIDGIDKAIGYVKKHPSGDIPPYLKDAHYKSASKLGHGIGYRYPHAFANHYVRQRYLPDSVNERFYSNSHIGYEKMQADYINAIITGQARDA